MTESKPERPYQYFDTPEGQDVFKKLWVVAKPAALTGVVISTIDVLCSRKPRSYIEVMGRFGYITLPIVGMAAAFVAFSNLSCQVRGKDDKLNWAIGAAAAGGVFGAWRRSPVAGFSAAGGFTILALIKKHCIENDWKWIPDKRRTAYGTVHGPRYDYTLTQERPRGWTTGQN